MSTTATKSQPGRTSARSAGKGSKSKSPSRKLKTTSAKTANQDGGKRLSPGALDGLVLDYMKRNRGKLPATYGVVGRGIKRSPGAIANCLERLEKAGKVKLINKKPSEYDLASSK
jgi:hypothetical protein